MTSLFPSLSVQVPFFEIASRERILEVALGKNVEKYGHKNPFSSVYKVPSKSEKKRFKKVVEEKRTEDALDEVTGEDDAIQTRAQRIKKKKTLENVDLDAVDAFVMADDEYAACKHVIQSLMSHDYADPFNQPVDPVALGIPDYPLIIKNPMDFSTILKYVKRKEYASLAEFEADIRLVFSNCYIYNAPTSAIYAMAQSVESYFEKLWTKVKPTSSSAAEKLEKARKKRKKEHGPQSPPQTSPSISSPTSQPTVQPRDPDSQTTQLNQVANVT